MQPVDDAGMFSGDWFDPPPPIAVVDVVCAYDPSPPISYSLDDRRHELQRRWGRLPEKATETIDSEESQGVEALVSC
ncbi:hypothetical protein L1887_13887 [Cichorium endivia]|nr:hypothetical protein L1887_13887 [Cichorium endivia]